MHLLYVMEKSGARARGREREKDTERIKSERRRVAEKGFGVGHKLNCWSSIYEGYRDRII
jgi:hypothetical protein